MSVFGSAQRLAYLGGHVSGQQGVSGQAQEWKNAQRQCVGLAHAVRICAGCGAKSMCTQGQSPSAEGAHGALALDRGAGAGTRSPEVLVLLL